MIPRSRLSILRVVSTFMIALALGCGASAAPGATHTESGSGAAARTKAAAQYGRLPLSFAPGAAGSETFVSRGNGYSLLLTRAGAELRLKSATAKPATVKMVIAGEKTDTRVSGEDRLPGTANYFVGNDPAHWRRNVPTFGAVRYSEVYPGIDLRFYGNRGELEYDFVVAAKTDPAQIRMRFEEGERLEIGSDGSLAIGEGEARIAFHKPVVYQEIGAGRRMVAGRFALVDAHTVGFELGHYDLSRPLVIDPTLVFSTYLGGSGFPGDQAAGIAIDADGNAYIAGSTNSTDFPVVSGSYDTSDPATSANVVFITKLNPAGTDEVYSTYLGGTWGDWAEAIALDRDGNAYVTGYTWSPNFPVTTGAYQPTNIGWSHSVVNAFITKLSADGSSLVYSTYLGGTGTLSTFGDTAHAIAVDSADNAYVTGEAYSTNFPVTSGAYQTKNRATQWGSNVFVTELSADGGGLVFSTYLGGSGIDVVGDTGRAIAIDADGNAYVAGGSYSSDFPTTKGAYQSKNFATSNKATNAFLAKFNPAGTALIYSTLLGGAGSAAGGDTAYGLAVDSAGDAYVAGEAYSGGFPVTTGAFQTTNYGATYLSSNAFVTKLNSEASGLIYSTFIGGYGSLEGPGDAAHGLVLDSYGDAYIAGWTYSLNFPVTVNAYQTSKKQNDDCEPLVTVVDAAGSGLIYSTYFGGSGSDSSAGLATDGKGNIYFTGTTYSGDFPVTKGAFQTTNHAATKDSPGTNAFVAKLALGAVGSPVATTTTLVSSANPATEGADIALTAKVKVQTGSVVPSGTVVFTVNGATVETVALSATGQAKLSKTFSLPGSYAIAARYAGNASFASSSASLTEVIRKPAAAEPQFTPAAGSYAPGFEVKLTDATAGATIYYTTNGLAPTTASRKYTAAGIKVTKTETIKAMAAAEGYQNSAISSAAYTIKPAAPTPAFSPAGATYNSAVTVKISDKATAGLDIYYTTNGTPPTTSSTEYTAAGIKVTKTETIEAIAVATGYSKSAVIKATYTIQ
jgi:hypothetical protein